MPRGFPTRWDPGGSRELRAACAPSPAPLSHTVSQQHQSRLPGPAPPPPTHTDRAGPAGPAWGRGELYRWSGECQWRPPGRCSVETGLSGTPPPPPPPSYRSHTVPGRGHRRRKHTPGRPTLLSLHAPRCPRLRSQSTTGVVVSPPSEAADRCG